MAWSVARRPGVQFASSRVLYFGTPRRTFVLLHAFRKRTEQTPDREIVTAEVRMRHYLEVFETKQGRE